MKVETAVAERNSKVDLNKVESDLNKILSEIRTKVEIKEASADKMSPLDRGTLKNL